MKAIVNQSYGTPDVLELADVDPPQIDDGQMLVRVHAAAANPLDWHFLTGTPYFLRLMAGLRRPKEPVRGVDVAGVVERVGTGVTGFAPGDRVFGGARGSFAELAAVRPSGVAAIPDGLSFAEAAALPVAAITALQGLRDHGGLQAGQSVLINGAAGGVGTYAVQIAKAMGAEVTGVCSTHNVEMVRSLGADHVVDYTTDDFAVEGREYDVILDNVGNRSLADCRRSLTPTGVYVMVSGPKTGKFLGPAKRMVASKLMFLFSRRRSVTFTANETAAELQALVDMIEDGTLRSVIDRTYPLADTAEAMRYLETGHARAKVIISVISD
jgi:NADPH:quinone reductase-like Zn-dependent oxidoreductase